MPENDLLPGVIPMQVGKYFIRCVRNTDVSGLSINKANLRDLKAATGL